jgi:thioredoxin
VLAYFRATWCPPCRIIAPFIQALSAEYADKAVIAKMATDENPMIPAQYGIMGIPTLIFFKDGKEVERMVARGLALEDGSPPIHTRSRELIRTVIALEMPCR